MERFEHSEEAGADAAAALLDDHPELTALVCTSDVLALGALRLAGERGFGVPGRLSVTGFDGVPEALRAGLTTVRQPVREKGRIAGQMLLDRGERTEPRIVVLPTELVLGTSTGKAPSQTWFSGL
jgi:DNA-binding LacI/PurR family transcriptional regulator